MTKCIIITGASSGIGREAALALSAPGHQLVLAARRQQLLLELLEECLDRGGAAHTVACDVSKVDDCRMLVEDARRIAGAATPVLINAAGVAEFGDFSEMPVASIENQIQTNLVAPLYLCHEVIPWMLESGRGQIVNVLSVAATRAFGGAVAYAAAKAGLLAAGRCLAEEYRRKGIRVSSILPGATDTPLWAGGGPSKSDMLPASAVAQAIADIVALPEDRNIDEILLMPPKGVL